MVNEKISLIIPTIGRLNCLNRFLKSLYRQSVLPKEVIVVDSGGEDISGSLENNAHINLKYITAEYPSLTEQKNIGLANIDKEAALVAFFDDDIVLERDSLKRMLDFWDGAGPDVGGASFNNRSDFFKKANLLERLFCSNSIRSGELLKSGFNSKISSIEKTKVVDWLLGGLTVWRRNVIDEFKFDEWFTGNAYCEDIDYSHRVAKKYKLMVVKEAAVSHLSCPIDFGKEYYYAKKQAENRVYLVRKHKRFSLLLCYWSCAGLFLKNVLVGVLGLKRRCFLRSMGILSGIMTTLFNSTNSEKR
ncbi:MAG: glycosyltransferase family 2 protein [Candidatus Omnitrophica bacterium]|nr:glycosyltransferase family 2 protein [Candidatus Omnitrophota bacterium]